MARRNNIDETKLIPNYVESDYSTALVKFKDLLKQDETFKDFNYHGSNIAMIIELMSYLADFTNFYTNLVAKNVYLDTANVYETVHRLVTQKGYIPLGYLSSEATVSVTIENDNIEEGNIIAVDDWQSIYSGTNFDNTAIIYTLTDKQLAEAEEDGIVSFDMRLRQGTIEELNYNGEDIIDNQIILPFRNYDAGMYPYEVPSIQLVVNDQEWIRVHDFYDHISGLIPDERSVFTFFYDKYERYVVSFASSMDVPNRSDQIRIRMLRSLGDDGIVGANTFDKNNLGVEGMTIQNTSKYTPTPGSTERITYSIDDITKFTNDDASVGGAKPEIITDLKANANANTHTQFRNVTSVDYKFHQEMRSDVVKATAWGEQEVDPGNTIEYNKVYVSCIPRMGNETMWMNGTLNSREVIWTDENVPGLSANIEIPTTYTDAFINDLLQYLEPRKMISVYEFPTVPDPVYFRFDIGIRVSRAYDYIDVANTVKDKLVYYFDSINREYNEEINFMDIHNFIYDLSIVSEDDDYLNVKGLDNLVIRDIATYTLSLSGGIDEAYHVYEPNTINNYPQYTQEVKDTYYENQLRPIMLGYDQFPMLSVEMCRFFNEGA